MKAKNIVDEFVAITLLSAIQYKTVEDMFSFAEIDNDYGFNICGDEDFYGMYLKEQEELFNSWHIKANELFLAKRFELLTLIGDINE